VHELDIDLPSRDLTAADIERVCQDFVTKYEQTYGKNSAYLEAGMEMVTFRVSGLVALDRPTLSVEDDRDVVDSVIGERPVHFGTADGFVTTTVHEGELLRAGQTLQGPAVIQRFGDTVVLPPGCQLAVDAFGGFTIRQETQR